METRDVVIEGSHEGERLDRFLAETLCDVSRSQVKNLIDEGLVLVGGRPQKPGYRIRKGDIIQVRIPAARETGLVAQEMPLNIVYEDRDLVVIDKPQGLVVHPAHGHWEGTLVNALLYRVKDLSGINGELRPGIVHRLDKGTSGLMVVAKNDQAHRDLADQIKARKIRREYVAVVHGVIRENSGTIDAPIGRSPSDRKKMAVVREGRPAVTHYTVLRRYRDYTLVRARLETGRTHQIRVHFAYIRHPVVGDQVYGPSRSRFELKGQALHACYLAFYHPTTKELLEFDSPFPPYFQELLRQLEKSGA